MFTQKIKNVIVDFGNATAAHKTRSIMLGLLAVFILPLVVIAQPASASSSCLTNRVCVYQHSNFGGISQSFTFTSYPSCRNLTTLDNIGSSLDNTTYHTVRYYAGANCNNLTLYITDGPSGYRTNLANDCAENQSGFCANMNDKISSFQIF